MSIRQRFLLIGVTVIVLLVAIVYLMTLEVQNQRNLANAEARRYASFKLADQLHQSSDDLTRMARTFVVTGDPVYERYFRRILAIRNGTAPRPEGYGGVYWDFVTATGQETPSDAAPVALQDLMRRMQFTDNEFAKLRESQEESDALVALEDEAMAAVKGLYIDDSGQYSVLGEPNMERARDLLHGAPYHRAKATIMAPIEEFTAMVEARTLRDTNALRERAGTLMRASLVLMGFAASLLVAGFVMLQRRVASPVGELAAAAERVEGGDYSGRIHTTATDEIGHLTRAFNQMSDAIESDIATRNRIGAELATAREAADEANQAKSAFLANMSHELRTPMNAILGYSEMLLEDAVADGDDETASDLKKIHSAGEHLLALINDVLDLSKIEAGRTDLYLESFEIPALVEEVVATVDTLIQKNENRLKVELDPSVAGMHADITKIRQALFNLLSNAAKFTQQGEIGLTIRAAEEEGDPWVEMAVSDSGIGIPADKLDHVFEEFSQAEESTSRNYGGTGLGLAISRRFCRMMGGDLVAESTLGEGSTFTIRVPLEVAPAAPAPEESPAAVTPAPRGERTVLVIDDDPNALDLLSRTLQSAGVRVVTASDGSEALRLARTLLPVAITLDVMMPGMDGWEVLRELKADPQTRDIPVVMVTMTDDRSLGYSLGATEYLTKPVQRAQLVQLLERYASTDSSRHALVVDDKAENREILRRALENENWNVTEAENGRLALRCVDEIAPSLILLDLMMPVMDGFDFVVEMRRKEKSRSIPIVVVTAKELTVEDRARLNGGIVGLIERGGLNQEEVLTELLAQIQSADPPSS